MSVAAKLYAVYQTIARDAQAIRESQLTAGEEVSGTVQRFIDGDAEFILHRWGEEMGELCGVIAGTHKDPYILEATQVFYWSCCYGVVRGATWEEIDFDRQYLEAPRLGIDIVDRLIDVVERLVAMGADAKPSKLFLLFSVADTLYRQKTPAANQRTLAEILEVDLQEMRKRPYLASILEEVGA